MLRSTVQVYGLATTRYRSAHRELRIARNTQNLWTSCLLAGSNPIFSIDTWHEYLQLELLGTQEMKSA